MASIFQVEYESGELVVRMSPRHIRLLPEATQEHLKAANKEFLLAFKSCLDSAINLMDRPKKTGGASRRTYIRVEEDEEAEETRD